MFDSITIMLFVGAVRVGCIDNEIVVNPTRRQMLESSIDMVVTATAGSKVGEYASLRYTKVKDHIAFMKRLLILVVYF